LIGEACDIGEQVNSPLTKVAALSNRSGIPIAVSLTELDHILALPVPFQGESLDCILSVEARGRPPESLVEKPRDSEKSDDPHSSIEIALNPSASQRGYSDLPALIYLLETKSLTFLDPGAWDDKNDSLFMRPYKEHRHLKCLNGGINGFVEGILTATLHSVQAKKESAIDHGFENENGTRIALKSNFRE
jgi:hypothetical protein